MLWLGSVHSIVDDKLLGQNQVMVESILLDRVCCKDTFTHFHRDRFYPSIKFSQLIIFLCILTWLGLCVIETSSTQKPECCLLFNEYRPFRYLWETPQAAPHAIQMVVVRKCKRHIYLERGLPFILNCFFVLCGLLFWSHELRRIEPLSEVVELGVQVKCRVHQWQHVHLIAGENLL